MSNGYTALSGVYDKLMYDVDYDSWANYIESLLPKGAKRIGETACGTGSITLRLAAKGYKLTASDLSEDMLNEAGANARKYGISATFICQNMTELALPPQHAIICCCDGVNYLTNDAELEKFFSSAYASLKEGGRLIFDISSRHKLKNIVGDKLFYDDSDEITCLWQNHFDEETSLLKTDVTVFKKEGEHYVRSDEAQLQRAYDVPDVIKALKAAGFKNINAYKFLTALPPDEDDERIQFTAEK